MLDRIGKWVKSLFPPTLEEDKAIIDALYNKRLIESIRGKRQLIAASPGDMVAVEMCSDTGRPLVKTRYKYDYCLETWYNIDIRRSSIGQYGRGRV